MDGALIEILAVALIWVGLVPCREAEGVDGVLAAAPADLGGLVGVLISGAPAQCPQAANCIANSSAPDCAVLLAGEFQVQVRRSNGSSVTVTGTQKVTLLGLRLKVPGCQCHAEIRLQIEIASTVTVADYDSDSAGGRLSEQSSVSDDQATAAIIVTYEATTPRNLMAQLESLENSKPTRT